MLYKGEIGNNGAFPPEVGVEPTSFFRELARRELEIAVAVGVFM